MIDLRRQGIFWEQSHNHNLSKTRLPGLYLVAVPEFQYLGASEDGCSKKGGEAATGNLGSNGSAPNLPPIEHALHRRM